MNSKSATPHADQGVHQGVHPGVPVAESIQHIQRLSEISTTLDLVICDLWGVMHNGISADPAAIEAMTQLRTQGVASVFLSNAPRPRYHVRDQLSAMGMPRHLTDLIVTSGGLARDAVRAEFRGSKLYHLGPTTDHNTVEGLPVDLVDDPGDADVILATDLDFKDIEKHKNLLSGARDRGVPLLCANPDRVVHVGEKLYACAGAVADLYSEMGGSVRWFGKPTPEALRSCLDEAGLHAVDDNKVLMIGDSLQTDIAGADAAGFRSLLIAGGIHRGEWQATMAALVEGKLLKPAFHKIYGDGKPAPDWVMNSLVW